MVCSLNVYFSNSRNNSNNIFIYLITEDEMLDKINFIMKPFIMKSLSNKLRKVKSKYCAYSTSPMRDEMFVRRILELEELINIEIKITKSK